MKITPSLFGEGVIPFRPEVIEKTERSTLKNEYQHSEDRAVSVWLIPGDG
jgi:hypothetical protein